MEDAQKTPTVCPACGAKAIVRIAYGLPSPELVEKADRGEVVLGGCCLAHGSKLWACRDCGHRGGFMVLREEDFQEFT
jgi:hypothetical protein